MSNNNNNYSELISQFRDILTQLEEISPDTDLSEIIASLENKADKENPVLTGSLSLGRDENSEKGQNSIAVGRGAIASGECSMAEGHCSEATGQYSYAEGFHAIASEAATHAEGIYTQADSGGQHVQGKYNIIDSNNTYAHIVGNGTDISRSNAHTIDWGGNAWFAGNVKVGGANYTGGSELATKAYVDDSAQPIVVTFTPAKQLDTGSEIKIRQIGHVVYITGSYLTADASRIGTPLGTATGVSAPTQHAESIPCVSISNVGDLHPGYIVINKSDQSISLNFYGETYDNMLIVNAFYIV